MAAVSARAFVILEPLLASFAHDGIAPHSELPVVLGLKAEAFSEFRSTGQAESSTNGGRHVRSTAYSLLSPSVCSIDDVRLEGEVLLFELYTNRNVFKKSAYPMPYLSILEEARQLNDVSERLKLLSAQHPLMEEALLTVCGNICNTATLLEVLVAIKTSKSPQFSTISIAELDSVAQADANQ